MTTSGFDRVRPRTPRPATTVIASGQDVEGKRALFSSAADIAVPGIGSALIECSRCQGRTILGLAEAVRASVPSLHLGFWVRHGDRQRGMSLRTSAYSTLMRCPACRRPSWVRFTLQI